MKISCAVAAGLLALTLMTSAQQRPKIASVSHLAVYTTDPAKTEHFYVHDLGAMKATDPENPLGVRYYFNPVQFVEVLPMPRDASPTNRFDHAGYNTSDADALRRYLGAHGVAVPASVTKLTDGSSLFEMKDPEGIRVQFVQPPAHPPAVPVNPLSKHMIHVGYIIHSAANEDAFYKALLGFRPYWHGGKTEDSSEWTSIQLPDGKDWLEYMTVSALDKTGAPNHVSLDTSGVLNHFALGVPNIEQSMNLLYAGDRLTGKHGAPQIGRDGKWQLNLYDPDGTRAEMMEFQPSVKPCCSPFLADSPTE